MRCLLIAVLIFAVCSPLHAAPAAPDPVDTVQPDGAAIKVSIRGDEFQNWIESEETGHTIMRNGADGYWEYAEQAADGSLKSTGIRVLPNGANAPINIPKRLRPPRNKEHETQIQQMLVDSYQQRISASSSPSSTTGSEAAPPASGDWASTPVAGTRKLLIVLVGFADRPITTTAAGWATDVFDMAAKSVAKYYRENSFDTLTVTPAPHSQSGSPTGVVSVTLTTNHPNTGGTSDFYSDQAWGNSALQQAAPFVNFNGFDTNGDGKLDTSELVIYFIAAGYETSATTLTPSMWAHAWWTSGTGLTAGSKNIQRWALNGEYYNSTTRMTMGVISHELGHQMCGLPDLYDISGNNQGLGNFSVMAGGSWGANIGELQGTTPTTLDAWSREYLGWSTPVIPTGSALISLEYPLVSKSSVYKLAIPTTSTTEYYLVENRLPTSWDLGLRYSLSSAWTGGLLITHIDNTAGTKGSNDINSYSANLPNPGHQGVVPVQASTNPCNMLAVGSTCRGNAKTLFYSSNNASWTPTSTPNSNYYDGAATNFSLTGISTAGAVMTAALSLGPPVVTFTDTPLALTSSQDATFSFTASDSSASLECKLDTEAYAACSSPHVTAALVDGQHTFIVRGTNSYGSTIGSYTWTVDTIPPDTTLLAGPQNPTTATAAVFDFSSPDATASFQCQLDAGSYASCSSGVSYDGLAVGSHSFSVRAADGAGNTDATPATYTWTVNPCHARIGSACYTTFAEAYAMANNGDTILAQAVYFPEALAGNRSINISFRGGYDPSFSNVIGFTTVQGLAITTDTIDVAGLAM